MKQYVDTGNADVETPSKGRRLRVLKPNMEYDNDSEDHWILRIQNQERYDIFNNCRSIQSAPLGLRVVYEQKQ